MGIENDLDIYIDQEVLRIAKLNVDGVYSVTFGRDMGCGYQNDIFVSLSCNREHDGTDNCMCRDVLDQSSLDDVDIDLVLAEKIAYYVAGQLGGLPVEN